MTNRDMVSRARPFLFLPLSRDRERCGSERERDFLSAGESDLRFDMSRDFLALLDRDRDLRGDFYYRYSVARISQQYFEIFSFR